MKKLLVQILVLLLPTTAFSREPVFENLSLSRLEFLSDSLHNSEDFAGRKEISMLLAIKYYDSNRFLESVSHFRLADSLTYLIRDLAGKTVEVKNEYELEFRNKSLKDSLQSAMMERERAFFHQKEMSRRQIITKGTVAGGAGMLLLAFVVFSGYRRKTKANKFISLQKSEIETQKSLALTRRKEVQQKNQEIIDSIRYASRLQNAVFPTHDELEKNLPGHFLFFCPRDVVAGDFYFQYKSEDQIWLAVADCTGHGVPGAMVSVICAGALKKAILENPDSDPAIVLEKVSQQVVNAFNKGGQQMNDGMDISFCRIDKKSRTLEWAGANNSLWILRNGIDALVEIKATKRPVGYSYAHEPFQNHSVSLNKGDRFYLFTDGFADQFGGEKGKKLKSSGFKKLLLETRKMDIKEQGNAIQKFFYSWKENLDQVDDVCVMGVELQ